MDILRNIQERIGQLAETINRHNYNYYILANPTISDYEFDMLLKELEALELQYPQFRLPDSPTMRVGGQVTKEFPPFVHIKPMLSLGNSYSEEDLIDFDSQCKKWAEGRTFGYYIEHKFDGVSMSLHYEKGLLVRAVTRGDGVRGDEITANVKTIRTIPLRLNGVNIPDFIEIRGEVMILRTDFDKWNEERVLNGEERLMNPRNATAGSLKLQNSEEVAKRPLTFFAYQVATDEANSLTDYENVLRFAEWGFKTSGNQALCKNMVEVLLYIHQWESKRYGLEYDIDGIVIKVNEIPLREMIGYTAKAPRWAIAFKYPAEKAITEIESVDFQVGRTGKVTPVANLKPVLLAGTIVKRASIHNADEIKRLDLYYGDTVYVEKGGEIIPKITGVVTEKRIASALPIMFITACPDCGTTLINPEKEVNYFCPNEQFCPPQLKGRIEHYAHRKAMNIEGLGTEIISQLVDKNLIRNYGDLYSLRYEELIHLDKFGDLSARNLLKAIDESKKIPFERVLFALGIRHVGAVAAKKLTKHFGSLEALSMATSDTLTLVKDIGETMANTIVAFFKDGKNIAVIEKLKAAGIQLSQDKSIKGTESIVSGSSLNGFSFVISGVFEHASREAIKDKITALGGEVKSGITKKTTYLLAGSDAGPAKVEKATELGVSIISEQDFLKMIQ